MSDVVTVKNCLARYWNGHARVNVVDKQRIKTIVRWLDNFMGHVPVLEFNDEWVNNYIDARKTGKVGRFKAKPGTIRRELGCLRTAFNYAAKQRLIKHDDIPHVYLPPAPQGKDFWLSIYEIADMRDYLNRCEGSRVHLFIEIALATAARKRSIELLTWDQVDFHNKMIRFDMQVDVQTRKRRVAVPMSDHLYKFFMQSPSANPPGLVEFVLGSPDSIRHEFDALKKQLAKEYNNPRFLQMTPHTLRHTAATHMLRNGVSLWQVAGMLGDSPETVAKTYGHHAADHLRDAANSMTMGAK